LTVKCLRLTIYKHERIIYEQRRDINIITGDNQQQKMLSQKS